MGKKAITRFWGTYSSPTPIVNMVLELAIHQRFDHQSRGWADIEY